MGEFVTRVPALKAKAEGAFEELYREMRPRLYRFAYSYTMNGEFAEDFVQDAFERLLVAVDNLPDDADVCNYLYTSVKNACLNYYKHLQVEDTHRSKLAEALVFAGTFEYEDRDALFDQVRGLLQQLPEQQRIVLEMKIFNEMSYAAIATRLGITEQTVHTHVKRAYKHIREHGGADCLHHLNCL